MEIVQAHAERFESNPDPRAYAAAANEWAELVREIGTARLDAQDAADAAIAESYARAAALRKAIAE
jgi:ABC-type Fe3+-hydroxamate transport system substrate-binding protein